MKDNQRSYCVYILSCADGSFYTGLTCYLARRLTEHQAGRGARSPACWAAAIALDGARPSWPAWSSVLWMGDRQLAWGAKDASI